MMDTTSYEVQEILAEYLRDERLDKVNKVFISDDFKETIYTKYVKRILDIVIIIPAIIITLPINVILGLLTLVVLGRPLFFFKTELEKMESFLSW